MKVTAAAGSTTTAGGMFFLSNGCCYVAVRGSSSGDAGVLPCLQHGKPAAHLQSLSVWRQQPSDLLDLSVPTHHGFNSSCSARVPVQELRLARPSGPNAPGARRPRRCSSGAHFLPPRCCSRGEVSGHVQKESWSALSYPYFWR